MTFSQAIPQFCSVPIQVGKRGKKGQMGKKLSNLTNSSSFSKFLKKIFLFFLFLTAAAKAVAEGTSKFIRYV